MEWSLGLRFARGSPMVVRCETCAPPDRREASRVGTLEAGRLALGTEASATASRPRAGLPIALAAAVGGVVGECRSGLRMVRAVNPRVSESARNQTGRGV